MKLHYDRILAEINSCRCKRSVDLCGVTIDTALLFDKINAGESAQLYEAMKERLQKVGVNEMRNEGQDAVVS